MGVPVRIRILKGGRVRIHWFCHAKEGPIHTGSEHHNLPGLGVLTLGGVSGYIACKPQLTTLQSPIVGGFREPIPCSDEVRAVTCPECIEKPEFKKACEQLAEALAATH